VAILRDHLVVQRDWLDEEKFTELFAIGQGLPGPTSTQLVISTALYRAGPLGGLLAFFLWNLPGLIILTTCGVLLAEFIDPDDPPFWLVGLPPAAISLVFQAFYGMGSKLDSLGVVLGLCSALVAILINNDDRISPKSSQWVFPTTLAIGGMITYIDHKREKPWSIYKSPGGGWDKESDETMSRIGIPLWVGACIFVLWAAILVVGIIARDVAGNDNVYLEIFETMYRIGSIIYGGGQVVLPLLQDEVVPSWMTKDQYLQGLGLAQSMPGPLFNFSAYLGAVYQNVPGALVAYVGLFGPGVILIFAVVPFWARLRHILAFKAILKGVNATAIGLVGAACVILWESAIVTAADAMVFCFALTVGFYFKIQAPIVILMGGVMGALLHDDVLDLGQQPYCIANGFNE
jgi:chromate transporter